MAEPDPTPAGSGATDAKIREEWQKLERQRIDEEIAEAREDAGAASPSGRRSSGLMWLAFAVALVAGIALTAVLNRGAGPGATKNPVPGQDRPGDRQPAAPAAVAP